MTGLFAQEIKVEGTVKDAEFGEPLPGVNVIVKNTTVGLSTDFDGNFSIGSVQSGQVLVFSYLGFKTQEIVLTDSSFLNVVLQEDRNALEEVVL